jgi:NAD(P)-dependent dehydrogenase (short-subunit alcohol dehydrogenase family)
MSKINSNSVCLVSGGGRGITAQAAIALSQQYQCQFILLGRSTISQAEPPWAQDRDCDGELELKKRILEHLLYLGEKPTPMMVQQEYKSLIAKREIEQTLEKIQQGGGKAEYLSIDITDRDNVAQELATVQKRLGAVTVIVHGAGNLADKPIEKKTEKDFDLVYAPKVKGLENLLHCVDSSQLDCLVLFSSVVGFYGNAGQTDYAIANEILNKTAYIFKQKQPQTHVVAINWGPWDSGMVSPELKRAFAERNITTIPIDAGVQMLVDELTPANQEVQVIIGSPLSPPASKPSPTSNYTIHRRLSLAANPFLHDHVIMERPVLPATCAISWMANICEQIAPGYKFFSCHNFKVLKGIVFDENLADEYILSLEKKTLDNFQKIEFSANIWSKNQSDKIRYHFNTKLELVREVPPQPDYQLLNLTQEESVGNQSGSFYQNGAKSLFHGASFQGVKKVLDFSDRNITIECLLPKLSPKQQGQFPVQTFNPYIVDVQIHALWLWLQHNHQEICLPSEIINYQQFAPIDFDRKFYVICEVKSKTKTAVVADIITCDRDNKIYSRMLGAKGTIISF